ELAIYQSLHGYDIEPNPVNDESWIYGPFVDHRGARPFFSRLVSVKFECGGITRLGRDVAVNCPAFLDAAHHKLQQIVFPYMVPDTLAIRFFEKCSSALTVVRMDFPNLTRTGFQGFASRCTGLQAFSVANPSHLDPLPFVEFLKVRGAQLVALKLGGSGRGVTDSHLILSIGKNCHSLVFLSISIQRNKPLEKYVMDLTQHCGRTLRQLHLLIEVQYWDWDSVWAELRQGDVFRAISECCPTLRELSLEVAESICMWDTVGTDTDSGSIGEALLTLVGKCKYLRKVYLPWLRHHKWEISHPDVRAKL
ncbi:hypothetical protein HK102_008369, partial [Quaeritorhiza haematococci]